MGVDNDDTIRDVGDSDQLASSIKTTAEMTLELFEHLRAGDMSRSEAFKMTQTWLSALMGKAPESKD